MAESNYQRKIENLDSTFTRFLLFVHGLIGTVGGGCVFVYINVVFFAAIPWKGDFDRTDATMAFIVIAYVFIGLHFALNAYSWANHNLLPDQKKIIGVANLLIRLCFLGFIITFLYIYRDKDVDDNDFFKVSINVANVYFIVFLLFDFTLMISYFYFFSPIELGKVDKQSRLHLHNYSNSTLSSYYASSDHGNIT
jgi:hypothetical protein